MNINPCAHPRCRDQDGNPQLTQQTICDPCRTHLARQIDWLRDDYLTLKAFMPQPKTTDQIRSTRVQFGHPTEWASDMAYAIAKNLNRIEDDARADLGDPPGFNIYTAREIEVMKSAHHYISARLDRIIDTNADTATDLADTVHDLHGTVRRTLGYNKQVQRLPGAHCPTCDAATLTRTVGQIDCESCGRIIPEKDYERLAHILAWDAIDRVIQQYEGRHAPA